MLARGERVESGPRQGSASPPARSLFEACSMGSRFGSINPKRQLGYPYRKRVQEVMGQ